MHFNYLEIKKNSANLRWKEKIIAHAFTMIVLKSFRIMASLNSKIFSNIFILLQS